MRKVLIAALLAVLAAPALAQRWPESRVHLIIPYAPGGNLNVSARDAGGHSSRPSSANPSFTWTKPGTGGLIAGEYVAKAAPDGYTLFVAANGPLLFSAAHLPAAGLSSSDQGLRADRRRVVHADGAAGQSEAQCQLDTCRGSSRLPRESPAT